VDEPIVAPAAALVVLIGAAGSGKSTFAQRNFPHEAIVASDVLRRARHGRDGSRRRNDVFDELHTIVEQRMQAGQLTVVDATNTDWMRRSELIRTARKYGRAAVAVVFDLPLETCLKQNSERPNPIPNHIVRRQVAAVHNDVGRLDLEGFSEVHVMREKEKGPVTRASG
jgi:protein phosphatase